MSARKSGNGLMRLSHQDRAGVKPALRECIVRVARLIFRAADRLSFERAQAGEGVCGVT